MLESVRKTTVKPVGVLIVEDSSIVCDRLAAFITPLRDVVLTGQANTGYQARELFHRHRPDAVILDLQLPDIDGMELITQFKAENRKCVVVVLTTYGFEEFRQRCSELGADHFFDKSLEFERAVAVLEAMARR
jgi:DNA-binding NarL/FixJ family response regulator